MNEDKSRRAFLVSMAASVAAASAMPDGLAASRVAGEGDPQTAARGDAGQAAVAQASDPVLKFAVIGLNHGHINAQTNAILGARGELAWVFAKEGDLVEAFRKQYPQAKPARSEDEVLEDASVKLVVIAAIPDERGPLRHQGDAARQGLHGRQARRDDARAAGRGAARPGRDEADLPIMYSERLENRATVKAGELVKAGAIGRVLQTVGLGPHRMNPKTRPAWFFERARYGGVLCDIASHQADQFLYFTGSSKADVVASQVGNLHHPQSRASRISATRSCGATAARATSAWTGSRRAAWPPGATAG